MQNEGESHEKTIFVLEFMLEIYWGGCYEEMKVWVLYECFTLLQKMLKKKELEKAQKQAERNRKIQEEREELMKDELEAEKARMADYEKELKVSKEKVLYNFCIAYMNIQYLTKAEY